ncbi:MAG: hypothetical protein B0D91_08630 [Oceanospirillales bacterium LUC14_002_19_P2]|nr:MAG: hypothetical protein B0D91_08630 [Oceanospirillales bacterium LUC14_002_19_P2]
MSPADLMSEGVNLMLFGMGFVFVFLTLLVIVTSIMSKIIQATKPEEPEPAVARVPVATVGDPASDPVLLAVIHEAVQQHRARRQ